MWDQVWQWMLDHHVYNTFVIISVLVLVFFPGQIGSLLGNFIGRFKKFKAGPAGIKFERQDIDPNTPCPYTKSRDMTFAALREINDKFDKLAGEVKENYHILKNVYIDQQKQTFYDKDQPNVERLAGGLNYISIGGNGDTKPKVEAFAGEHPEIYHALTLKKPELKFKY